MEIFLQFTELLAETPAWVPLVLLPALTACAAVLFTLAGGRRAYPCVSGAFVAAGFALMCCLTETGGAFVYAGTFAALAALLALLFFLPRPKRRRGTTREERIYERFRGEPLPAPAPQEGPAKVCCFETPAPVAAAPDLEHALTLLGRVRKAKLSSADRLETDVLLRTLSAMQGRQLTEQEQGIVNDSLSSVLKLAGKYKV